MNRRPPSSHRVRAPQLVAAAALAAAILGLAACDGDAVLPTPLPGFTTFQPASLVLGQPDFTSNAMDAGQPTATARNIDFPQALASVLNGRLYLPDWDNNRVKVYNTFPAANYAPADFALGQPNLTSDLPAITQTGMTQPVTVATWNGRYYVTDQGNNRLLFYNAAPGASGPPADGVLGQPDFVSSAPVCAPAGMNQPAGMAVAGGRMVVGDGQHHRVLIWNTVPTASFVPPDVVLGQSIFGTCVQNDDNQDAAPDPTPSARTLDTPNSAWTDGTRLVVADANNHRVLIWNTLPTANFTPADIVLGQPDFTSRAAGVGADGFNLPTSVASNGVQLVVADFLNHRVLIWNQFPTQHRQPADVVLGQSTFNNVTPNDDDQNGTIDPTTSARTLDGPIGVALSGFRLIVSDANNHRFLVYEGQ